MSKETAHLTRIRKYYAAIGRYNTTYISNSVKSKSRTADKISPTNISYQRKYENDLSNFLKRTTAKEWREGGGNLKDLKEFRKSYEYSPAARITEIRQQLDGQIDLAMRLNAGKNLSEREMINEVRKMLRNPNELQKIARQQIGDRKNLKYDKGDYKKVARNIERLASDQATTFYRAAQLKALSKDKDVTGIEIFLSPDHKVFDICDILVGFYPKDFYYTKFHIGCKCAFKPIYGGKVIDDVPRNYKEWIKGNQDRIDQAKFVPDWISKNVMFKQEYTDLLKAAQNSTPEIEKVLNKILKEQGGFATPMNYKSRASMYRKVTNECDGDVSQVKDAIRVTVILPRKVLNDIIPVLEKISIFDPANGGRIKPQTADKFDGYSGIITNVKTSYNISGEIQFNTEKMIYAKEKPEDAIRVLGLKRWKQIEKEKGLPGGLGHYFYEKIRDIQDKNDPMRVLYVRKSIEYYKNFQD